MQNKMECEEIISLMSPYLDDEVEAGVRPHIDRHLENCTMCSSTFEDTRHLGSTVRRYGIRHTAPIGLRQRIHEAVQERQTPRRRVIRWSWAWVNGIGALGSCTALLLVLILQPKPPSATDQLDQELIASHYRSLMSTHLIDVVSSDQHTAKPWFAGKLDFSPPVVDFNADAFPLLGGRVDYIDQRPVAALAYRHRKHVLNLYVSPVKGDEPPRPFSTTRQGFQLLHWTRAGMAYRLISDASAADLVAFREQLDKALDASNQ